VLQVHTEFSIFNILVLQVHTKFSIIQQSSVAGPY